MPDSGTPRSAAFTEIAGYVQCVVLVSGLLMRPRGQPALTGTSGEPRLGRTTGTGFDLRAPLGSNTLYSVDAAILRH